jgi:hypothetical protein
MTTLDAILIAEGINDSTKRQELIATIRSAAATTTRTAHIRTMSAAAAANPENVGALKMLKAQAQRLGFEIKENELINSFELNEVLKGKDVSARLELKVGLAKLALIA